MSGKETQIPCDFTHVWNIKNNKPEREQTKQDHVDTENRVAVARGEGAAGRVKWVEGMNCMVMARN